MVELLIAAFPTNSVALPAPEMIESLTDRKLAVLRLIATGLSNKEIAQRLIVSIHSVRNHTANIFGKLQVENQVQAVERAHTLALLPPI
jgi:LuxR family maltose regulon positive regulatory protein